jgi:photosystem II oxygen-evolving enhancer protein 2
MAAMVFDGNVFKGNGEMLKRVAVLVLLLVGLSLQGCVSAGAGLKSFVNTYSGYEFLYPNSWVEVKVADGPDVVLHDLIEETENISVVISPVPDNKSLAQLGSPSEVGYKLSKNAIAPPGSGREADLINAESRAVGTETYYLLEYLVQFPNKVARHNIASVVVRRGQLFTLNLSTTEQRWQKNQDLFKQIVDSFNVY